MKKLIGTCCGILLGTILLSSVAHSENDQGNVGSACRAPLPTYSQLKTALVSAIAAANGGFNLNMWATVVNRDGIVCAVVFTGNDRGDQWPGSRVISAQKANTANAFSLPKTNPSRGFPNGLALSTANLYSAVQPGGSLYGLQASNPVSTEEAYEGSPANYGQPNDPMVGGRIGGVNVFGGGLALYAKDGQGNVTLVGGVGVSGDSSCADHNVAWRVRNSVGLDHVPAGVSGDPLRPDNIVFDIVTPPNQMNGKSASGWGHPSCGADGTAATLPHTN